MMVQNTTTIPLAKDFKVADAVEIDTTVDGRLITMSLLDDKGFAVAITLLDPDEALSISKGLAKAAMDCITPKGTA